MNMNIYMCIHIYMYICTCIYIYIYIYENDLYLTFYYLGPCEVCACILLSLLVQILDVTARVSLTPPPNNPPTGVPRV